MKVSGFCNSIMIFNNGYHALNNLKSIIETGEHVPDVILLDLNMPIMDGWQFLDEFVKIKCEKEIHIYIVSSSVDPADRKRVDNYQNISNFILKPISKKELEMITHEISIS